MDQTDLYIPALAKTDLCKPAKITDAIRLDMTKAVTYLGGENAVNALSFTELGTGKAQTIALNAQHLLHACGDIVLARRDIGTSYHMAVVVDDALQNITTVTRGQDMQSATPIHVILQKLLHLETPNYRHHRLIRDPDGKRLAKRDNARSIQELRAQGLSVQNIRQMLNLP